MGKLQEFEITFNNNKVVYSPGESISGTLKISLTQPLQCKALKVNCNGFCGVTNKINDTAWTTEEQYFNSTISVADKGTLKEGDHCFPFKFLIPASAPTSFEGNYGKIIYRIRAFVDTPRFAKDYKTEKSFFLLNLFNLNEVPDILGPNCSEVTQQFTYLLLKTGTVVLKAECDKKGYTPGEVIQLTTKIHNQSGKATGMVVANLMQRVTYGLKKPTHDVRTIAEVEGAAVKAGKEVEWKEQIIVPALPQSELSGCELIKIQYYIKVTLKSPEVTLTLPIHIGNVMLDKRAHASSKKAPSTLATDGTTSNTPALASPAAQEASLSLPPRPAPKPAPRPAPRTTRPCSYISPSAPPAEYPLEADGGAAARGRRSDSVPSKSHSQLSAAGMQSPASPNAFSYAPGLSFSENQHHNAGATPTPALYPVILPPDYSTSDYPQEAPPSYDASCST